MYFFCCSHIKQDLEQWSILNVSVAASINAIKINIFSAFSQSCLIFFRTYKQRITFYMQQDDALTNDTEAQSLGLKTIT